MRTFLVVLVVLGLSAGMYADSFDRIVSADARIDANAPDTNYGGDAGTCGTGRGSSAVLYGMDLSDLAGYTVTDDGTFSVRVYWKEGSLLMGVYELTGGAFDEMSVTFNSYVGAGGDITDVLGDMLDSSDQSGWLDFTVPMDTIQAMIDGTSAGLATSNVVGSYWNHCQGTLERPADYWAHLAFEATTGGTPVPGDANGDGAVTDADYTIWADNYAALDATVEMGDFNGDGEVSDADYTIWADNYGTGVEAIPEPATLTVLALTGLLALRRRR
jgi:hypothetical protein